MTRETFPLFQAAQSAAIDAAALDVLHSGQIAAGPKVQTFERELQAWTGRPHALSTNDMSSAMGLALHLSGVKAGDEVLTPTYTCMSSAAPIANLGARPRWVDVDASTGLLCAKQLKQRLSPRVKACVLYHAAGYPAEVEPVADFCKTHGIALIEDCNNALGAQVGGRPVGCVGDFAVYGFYPNRLLHAGDGGLLAVPDADTLGRATRLRRFGIDLPRFRDALGEIHPESDIPEVGWSMAMSQLSAAIGLAQLPAFGDRLQKVRANAHQLAEALSDQAGLELVPPTPGAQPSYWGLMVLADARDALLGELKRRGIMASKLHHRLDAYSGLKADAVELPGTTQFMARVLALPCGPWFEAEEIRTIADRVKASLRAVHG